MGHLATKMNGTKLGTVLSAGETCYSKIGASEREFLTEVRPLGLWERFVAVSGSVEKLRGDICW